VLYPPNVFSYFAPGFPVPGITGSDGLPLAGPELQILTSVTAFERANFVASVLGSLFSDGVYTFDGTAFTTRARDAAALVDYCNLVFMGGRMAPQERTGLVDAVRRFNVTSTVERAGTALYLTLVLAQDQVNR
jgi:hypothetical protein